MTPVFDAVRFSAVALDVAAAGQSTRDAIAARQHARLLRLIKTSAQGSSLYCERLKGFSAATMDLTAIPFVTKHELMQRFDEWVSDPALTLPELQEFLADPACIAAPYLGKYIVWESSGSGGQPGVFVQDAGAMATYDALEALRRSNPQRLQRWLDPLGLSERTAFVAATGGHFASFVSVQRLRQLNPWMAQTIRCFSILQPTSALIAELNEFSPTIIATYPTVAALLADEALRGSLHIRPREVLTGGETLTPAVRQRVERLLGATVRNNYGASEFLSIAWECAHGHLHVNADWVILEPVDEKHRPVPPGEPSHSCLLTNLANMVQPLIRYDLSDQITVSAALCACGSPLSVIEVVGRTDDALMMRGKDGSNVTLLPLALTTVLEELADLFDFQLRQLDKSKLELNLQGIGIEGTAQWERGRSVLQAFAQSQGLAPIEVTGKSGVTLTRGRSGKVQRVIASRQKKPSR